MKFIIQSIEELNPLATEILKLSKNRKVFILKGDLGTGKTSLIKEFCSILKVQEETSSPTYSIVNEYSTPDQKVYHIDLYRLNSIEEAFEVGLEDYLYSDNYCFIEWPQIAKELLPDHFISISIEKTDENSRVFLIDLV